MNLDIQNSVLSFIAETVNLDQSKLGFETTLLGDLGIDGDDAEDFIRSFAETFQVNLNNFRFADHFGNEGISLSQIPSFFSHLIKGVRGNDPHALAGKLPIIVKDLIIAAETKQWPKSRDA